MDGERGLSGLTGGLGWTRTGDGGVEVVKEGETGGVVTKAWSWNRPRLWLMPWCWWVVSVVMVDPDCRGTKERMKALPVPDKLKALRSRHRQTKRSPNRLVH